MSLRRTGRPRLSWWHALLIASIPSACATGVQQDFADEDDPSDAGSGSGGALNGGSAGSLPKAGSSSGGNGGSGVSNPFGGTSGSGGKASAGSGGGGMDNGGSAGKATGGSGGASGGSGGASAGSGGGGGDACGCVKTLTWVDDTNISFTTGDCFKVGDATYKYVGKIAQTWAHKDCNPTKQLSWCGDPNTDYTFTLCP